VSAKDNESCPQGACERRLHQRIGEKISWKVAAVIVTLLGFGIIGAYSYTSIALGETKQVFQREQDRQDRNIDKLDSKLDAILAAIANPRNRKGE
jgi:hypothetical protein